MSLSKVRMVTSVLLLLTLVYAMSSIIFLMEGPTEVYHDAHVTVQGYLSGEECVLQCFGEVLPTSNESEWRSESTNKIIRAAFKCTFEKSSNIYVREAVEHCGWFVLVPQEEYEPLPTEEGTGVYRIDDSYYLFRRYISHLCVDTFSSPFSRHGLSVFFPEGVGEPVLGIG